MKLNKNIKTCNFKILKESWSSNIHQGCSSNESSNHSLNSLSLIPPSNPWGTHIHDKFWCVIWRDDRSISSNVIVIACSSFSIGAWQAIFSSVILTSEICIVRCLTFCSNHPIANYIKTSWISCSVEKYRIEVRVHYICTAISSDALTGNGTLRARSAAIAWWACSVCHGWVIIT